MSYDPDTRSCIAKFKRAEAHLKDLKSMPSKDGPYPHTAAIRAKFDPQTGYYIARVLSMPEEFLTQCGIITGDCISNLRGCLDHLAWQLALASSNGRTPPRPKQIYFPIFNYARTKRLPGGRDRPGFDTCELVKQISSANRTILTSFQPYRGGHGKKLAVLDRMWNEDKHRTLVRFRISATGWTRWNPREFDPETWDQTHVDYVVTDLDLHNVAKWPKVGAEIVRFRVVPMPKNKVDVDTQFSGEVILANLGPAVEALRVLAESVRAVLEAFGIEPT